MLLNLRKRFRLAALLSIVAVAGLPAYLYATTVLTKFQMDVSIGGLYENTGDAIATDAEQIIKYTISESMTDGDAVDKAEIFWCKADSVIASGTDSWDLSSTGANITDAFGTTLTFAKLKFVLIQNLSTTAGDILRVTRPATDGFAVFGADADYASVGPDGTFLWYNPSLAGVAVADGDTDNIDIVEAGAANTVSYRICLVGTD